MIDSKEAFKLSMEIANHPEYLKTIEKYNIATESDLLSLEIRVNSIASTIGAYASDNHFQVSDDKLTFLTKSFILGKVDGGEPTIKYVNKNIPDSNNRVYEYNIMMRRLRKIFDADSIIFSEEVLEELKNLYGSDSRLVESCIIRTAYALELVYAYLSKNKNYSRSDISKFIMELSKKIGEVYKQTKSIKITEDISNLIKEAVKSIPDLPPEMQEDIDELIEKYNSGELNKDEFIDGLSYAEVYEKKNKYVR